MGEDHDSAKPSKFIKYLDANNLYGWAMCKPPPVEGFKWMTEEELKSWENIPCILEVIYQTRATVFHRDIQTPRRELKIRRAAEYF